MYWIFYPDVISATVSERTRAIVLKCSQHELHVDYMQPMPDFEPTTVAALQARSAILRIETGVAAEQIRGLRKTEGQTLIASKEAKGLISLWSDIELHWWVDEAFFSRIADLLANPLFANKARIHVAFGPLPLSVGGFSLRTNTECYEKFLAGELAAELLDYPQVTATVDSPPKP
jgi:hypothetical protein